MPQGRRSRWVSLALALTLLFTIVAAALGIRYVIRPNGGFLFVEGIDTHRVMAAPTTSAAARAVEGLHGFLGLVELNGVRFDREPNGELLALEAQRLLDLRPGASNTFTVREPNGAERSFTIPVERFDFTSHPYRGAIGGYWFIGVVYLLIGVVVWWKKPGDRAAEALLLLGIVAKFAMEQIPPYDPLSRAFAILSGSFSPLYGAAGVLLALEFTHRPPGFARSLRRWTAVVSFVLVLLGPPLFHLWALGAPDVFLRSLLVITGVHLSACCVIIIWLMISVNKSASGPAVRARARLFAGAVGIAFVVPSVQLILFPLLEIYPEWLIVGNMFMFATFPAVVGYAIVRHHMFDLRIALRRGVIYGLLSLIVSLTYAALIIALVHVLGPRVAGAPLFIGSLVVVTVLLVSVVQVQVQRRVERFVFRRRYVYASALAAASDRISRSRSIEDACEVAKSALIGSMELARGALVLKTNGGLRTIELGNHPDLETGIVPPIPSHDTAELARVLTEKIPLSRYDLDASEATWKAYGLDMMIPLGGVGALLIGPRLGGARLDREDLNLLTTLGNQLSIAIDNANAFEEIQRLKEGLEEKVRERTYELTCALEELRETEVVLVESEKQAMLGKLVAGIVHEVNTPLGALTSSADTIVRAIDRLEHLTERSEPIARTIDQARKLASVQRESSARISKLVASLERFANLDQAGTRRVDVRQSIDDALEILALGDRIEVVRRYPERALEALCDPTRLSQVFLTVLQNASEAIEGPGRIEVGVAKTNGRITVEIADSGRGIPPEELPAIFDFGFTKKRGRVGLRLGLPASKRAIDGMGGSISIDSVVAHGTRVKIEIPQVNDAET